MRRRLIVWACLFLLVALPVADALSVAARSAKVRPSEEYSPDTAWEAGYYGCGVTVAIFDEGVDDDHPWLAGKVAAGVDVTATGVIWDTAGDGNPQPLQGTHGTPVAGIVMGHAGQPMFRPGEVPQWADDDHVGVAPCAWMVDVQFNDVTGAGSGAAGEMVAAFDWAIANVDNDWGDDDPLNDGIDIITMSWSPNDETTGNDPVCAAAERAIDAGIVVLGSAGNSGKLDGEDDKPELGCPTGSDRSISVANICDGGPQNPTSRTVTRDDDAVCSHSTWGPRTDDGDDDLHEELQPDIAAPGQGVMSTNAGLLTGGEYAIIGCGDDSAVPVDGAGTPADCETSFGGTSAATPFMAGVVALMLEANTNLTPVDVKEIIHQAAEPFADQEATEPTLNAKWNFRRGYGFIDAHRAVMLAATWPGMALGADTDSDGVRDYLDAEPLNALVQDRVAPRLPAVGGDVDSDGDGIVDGQDDAPLDPTNADAPGAAPEESTPAPGAIVALLALLGWAVRRR